MLAAQQIHATRGRWYILLLISLMYLITYLDRVNISTAAPVISKEFGFDKITMGAIFSAFVWAYALFQVPGGWLGDRLGPRRILTAIVTYWSVMTAATAMAGSAVSFIVVRFLFGIGEAGAFPVATRAMQLWYPREERGFVQGITHSASRAGAAIAPPIVVAIMSTLGWQWVFYICGAVGLVWAAWWYFSYRDLPEDHPMVNQIELQRIRGLDQAGNINQATTEAKASVPVGDREIVNHRRIGWCEPVLAHEVALRVGDAKRDAAACFAFDCIAVEHHLARDRIGLGMRREGL
jgi:MFS family permease